MRKNALKIMYKKLLVNKKSKITILGIIFISLIHLIIYKNFDTKYNVYLTIAQDYKKNEFIYDNDEFNNALLFAHKVTSGEIKKKFKIDRLFYVFNRNEFHLRTKGNLVEILNDFEEKLGKIIYDFMILQNTKQLKIYENTYEDITETINMYSFEKSKELVKLLTVMQGKKNNLRILNKNKTIYITTDINYEQNNILNNILIILITNIFLYLLFVKIYFKK